MTRLCFGRLATEQTDPVPPAGRDDDDGGRMPRVLLFSPVCEDNG